MQNDFEQIAYFLNKHTRFDDWLIDRPKRVHRLNSQKLGVDCSISVKSERWSFRLNRRKTVSIDETNLEIVAKKFYKECLAHYRLTEDRVNEIRDLIESCPSSNDLPDANWD